jgi:WD40 repeat protein
MVLLLFLSCTCCGRKGHLEGDQWDLAALPVKLADITTSSSSHIIAAAVAPDASAVAASDRHKLRLFRLSKSTDTDAGDDGSASKQQLTITRVKLQQQLDAPVVCCTFSSDSRHLFATTGKGRVVAIEVSTGRVVASQQLAAAGGSSGQKAKQQQQQATWCASLAWAMPAASLMAASSDGQLLAVATAAGVQLLSASADANGALLAPRHQLALLGEPAAVTALQFNPASRVIAVATAANALSAFDAASGLPTAWSLQQAEAVAELLEGLPGSIVGLSFRPCSKAQHSLIVYSPGGLCHLNMDAPLAAGKADMVLAQAAAGSSGKQRRKQRKQQSARGGGGGAAGHNAAAAEVGRNGRLLQLQHCCLLVGHLSAGEALLLERPWHEVLQGLTPPLYRHRYGS